MVSFKGRLNACSDRVGRDYKTNKGGEVKSFKVFTEGSRETIRDSLDIQTKKKFFPPSSSSYPVNDTDSKRDIKNRENSKSKLEKPPKTNARRNVLADISNLKSSSSKNERGKSSIHSDAGSMGATKSRPLDKTYKISKDCKALNLSGKQGQVRLGMNQPTKGNKIIKNIVIENMNAISYEPRTKVQVRNSITATSRIPSRIPLHMTRKSFPVSKQAFKMEINGRTKVAMESSDKSKKSKEKHDCPVNPTFRRSFVPKPKILSSGPWGNTVNDGYVVISSRAQTNDNTRMLSRTSVKNQVMTVRSCNSQS